MIIRTILAALALLFSLTASAQIKQQITSSQIATLKAACLADTVTCKPLHDAANDEALAAYFNGDTATFIVWKTSVTKEDVTANDSFAWDRVDNLSVGKARIWDALFDNPARAINPAKANVRAGIAAAWVGTAADLAVQAAPAPAGVMEMRIVGMPERVTESTVERNPGTGQIVKSTQIERDQE